MKKILHIEASPRKDRSHSINVTKKYIDKIQKNGDVEIKKIDLWNYDLPEFDGDMLNAKYAAKLPDVPFSLAPLIDAW